MTRIRVAGAQIDLTVGDLSGNEERILEAMVWAEKVEADVLIRRRTSSFVRGLSRRTSACCNASRRHPVAAQQWWDLSTLSKKV